MDPSLYIFGRTQRTDGVWRNPNASCGSWTSPGGPINHIRSGGGHNRRKGTAGGTGSKHLPIPKCSGKNCVGQGRTFNPLRRYNRTNGSTNTTVIKKALFIRLHRQRALRAGLHTSFAAGTTFSNYRYCGAFHSRSLPAISNKAFFSQALLAIRSSAKTVFAC